MWMEELCMKEGGWENNVKEGEKEDNMDEGNKDNKCRWRCVDEKVKRGCRIWMWVKKCGGKIWVWGDVWMWMNKTSCMRFIKKVKETIYEWEDLSSLNISH